LNASLMFNVGSRSSSCIRGWEAKARHGHCRLWCSLKIIAALYLEHLYSNGIWNVWQYLQLLHIITGQETWASTEALVFVAMSPLHCLAMESLLSLVELL
jgi:hypothetical protein